MKPLIVLIVSFILAILIIKLFNKKYRFFTAGRIALSLMLLFTSLGHFMFPSGMSNMLPDIIPYRMQLIYLTGILEVAAAMAILIPGVRKTTGYLLIVFFLTILPANIYASVHHINYQTGAADGPGLSYLWFRIPLQILFIVWTYICCIKYRKSD